MNLKTHRDRVLATGQLTVKPQSILAFGESFTGKTKTVAEQLAPHFKLIWLDVENGLQTLLQLPDELLENITYIRIPDTATNPVAIKTIGLFFSANKPIRICYEHGEVGCVKCKGEEQAYLFDPNTIGQDTVVVVDSLTQVSDSAIKFTMQSSEKSIFTVGPGKAGYDEFGGQGALLLSLLSHMQHAPYHRVFISHAEFIQEQTGGEKIYPVCGTRTLSSKVSRYFDHVVFLYRKNNKHNMASSTTFAHNIMCGSRSDVDVAEGATLVDMLRGTKPVKVNDNGDAKAKAGVAGGILAQQRAKIAAQKAAQSLTKDSDKTE